MILEQSFIALASAGALGLFFYVRPLRKSYFEMSDRAEVFSRRGESLFAAKKAILENIEEGVVTCDREGRITYINMRAILLLKLKNTSILSKSIKSVAKEEVGEVFSEIEKLFNQVSSQKERARGFVTSDDSNKAYIEIIIVPSEDAFGYNIILKDRSDQQKVVEMGKEFIANASHELRTPVTIIRGFAETLQDLEEISEEMFDSILSKIIRSCERMEVLVKNLLTLADLDASSKTQMHECDLLPIIDEVCYNILNISPNTHIERLQNKDSVVVYASTSLLELALFNILKNAVRYSSSKADIKITIDANDEVVELKIQDQGMGIEEGELTKIFDRFYTVNKSHSRSFGGAGVGLSIVKMIVSIHEGKIWATSQLGRGTTFHIILPRL